jgi:hypothetical protein
MLGTHQKGEVDSLYRGALLLAAGSLALMSLATCVSLLQGSRTRRERSASNDALRIGRSDIRLLPRG